MQLELPENVTTYFGPSSSKPTIALNQLQCTMYCTSRAHLYHKQRQNTCGTPRRAVAISLQDGGGGGWVEVVQQYVLWQFFFFPRPSELSELTIPLQQLHRTMYFTSRAHMYHKQKQHTCGLWNPKTRYSGRWGRWWVGWYSAAISCASPAGEVSDDATCLEQCSAGNEFPGCHNQMYLSWRKWTTPRVGEFWEWFLLMGRDIFLPQIEWYGWSKCCFFCVLPWTF